MHLESCPGSSDGSRSNLGPLDVLPRDGFWTEGGALERGEPACRLSLDRRRGSHTVWRGRGRGGDRDPDAEVQRVRDHERPSDDSREADERAVERRLRELRARVKAARAALSGTPDAEELLLKDWMKGAHFYARFGITEGMFRNGVSGTEMLNDDHEDRFRGLRDDLNEPREREATILPERGDKR
jgi:hypothetical protein